MRRFRLPRPPSIKSFVQGRLEFLRKMRERFLADPYYRLRVILLSGAAFMVFVLPATFWVPLTSGAEFCAACHSMKENYRTLKKSAHSEVTCYACHEPPSYLVILWAKVYGGPQDIFKEFTGRYHKPMNAESHLSTEIPSEWCFRCHSTDKREFTLPGLLVNHWVHEKEGLNCTFCHNRVAHDGIEGYKNRLEEKYCFDCHIAEKVERAMPDNCAACHKKAPALL